MPSHGSKIYWSCLILSDVGLGGSGQPRGQLCAVRPHTAATSGFWDGCWVVETRRRPPGCLSQLFDRCHWKIGRYRRGGDTVGLSTGTEAGWGQTSEVYGPCGLLSTASNMEEGDGHPFAETLWPKKSMEKASNKCFHGNDEDMLSSAGGPHKPPCSGWRCAGHPGSWRHFPSRQWVSLSSVGKYRPCFAARTEDAVTRKGRTGSWWLSSACWLVESESVIVLEILSSSGRFSTMSSTNFTDSLLGEYIH